MKLELLGVMVAEQPVGSDRHRPIVLGTAQLRNLPRQKSYSILAWVLRIPAVQASLLVTCHFHFAISFAVFVRRNGAQKSGLSCIAKPEVCSSHANTIVLSSLSRQGACGRARTLPERCPYSEEDDCGPLGHAKREVAMSYISGTSIFSSVLDT